MEKVGMSNFLPPWEVMLLVDITLIAVAIIGTVIVFRYRHILRSLNVSLGIGLLLTGLWLGVALYLFDFSIMFIVPSIDGLEISMSRMINIHLNYSWYFNTASTLFIVLGLALTLPRLLALFLKEREVASALNLSRVQLESSNEELRISSAALKITNSEVNFQKYALDEHAIVSIADGAGDITYVNDKFCAISGYDNEELLGNNHKIVKSDEHPDAFFVDMWKTISSGHTWHGEIKNTNKAGEDYWVKTTIVPTLDDKSKPIKYVGIHTDMTESKQAELREKSRTHVLELITTGEPLPVILESIVRVVEQENPAMLCSILLLDDAGKHLLSGAASSLPDFYNEAVHREEIGIGAGSCGTAAFINERVIVDDIQTHPYWEPYKELASKAKLGACWSEPIRSTKGEVLGTFAIYHRKAHYPTEANLTLIKKTGGLASIAIENRQTRENLGRIAHYDALTNLPNRVLLAERLSHAMVECQRRNQSLAVAFMDLDSFKTVNDLHGHNVGDELLVAVAQRMKKALREGDTLARIGGDEFIAVMVDLENIEDSEPVLKRLLKAAADPITLGDAVMQISASIGVSLYPQDHVDSDLLMRHADQAMYVAKQAGKNRYHFFDTAQDSAIKTQRQSIGYIRSALDRREFLMHYQPKVNMHTSEVIGVEALIRWQHPVRGLVPPLDFLPAIEGHAISLELGEWVIDTALSQISQWRSMGIALPISVNISGYQLQQRNFSTRLAALLAAHPDVNPHHLELEILETSVLSDISQVFDTMSACHDLDVRFSLDDFGTGYSSLTHIKRLPAYLIKIDQSFVRDMLEDVDDLAIVESVIGLAKTFKREVIAEGVETIEHGVALLKLGCELAQGYGIARPMPADDIPEWVSSWKADDSWRV
jgi:diguanylate cyclase (GGDEF)-like protein/PAS domain S-box-containing protein